jgi:hypothetical protein
LNAQQQNIDLTVGELLEVRSFGLQFEFIELNLFVLTEQMYQNTSILKVQFSAQWSRPFSYGNGARIYPIARMVNWENGLFDELIICDH